MDKSALRTQLKHQRRGLTTQELISKSRLITSRVIAAVDWKKIKSVHCYAAFERTNEVQTDGLQGWVRRRGIFIKNPTNELSLEELTYKFDLIIVPILGFDRSLNRLGYGGGFYDRLLDAHPQTLKIGLAYDLSLVEAGIPVESHDQRLDQIYTESASFSR